MKEGWEIKKLGEVCDILDSQRKPVTKKDRREGCYPYYGAMGIQDYVDSYIFDGRFLLVGEDGAKWGANDKSAFIIEGKSWVNNHAHILKIHDYIIDTFVEYYLVFRDLNEYITGAIVPKLTQQALKNIPIPIPPLPEQERIVAELDCLSGIIEKKKQQLKEYDALAQSIFYEMFGDPVENEKGWEMKNLGEIASEIFAGGDKPKDISSIKTDEYAYPVYANGDGDRGLLGFSKNYRVGSKAVTIGARGASVGNCRICNEKFTPVVRLITIVPSVNIDIIFLYHYVLHIEWDANGAGQAQLTTPNVVNKKVFLPPLALQQEFASKIEAIEKQKELIKKSIEKVETLFNSKMYFYFN